MWRLVFGSRNPNMAVACLVEAYMRRAHYAKRETGQVVAAWTEL